MRKEIDPKIHGAAKSYAAQFSERTPLAHFVTFYFAESRCYARIEYDENRARTWAYQSGGECFAVQPIAGENGATIARLKPLTAAQWRAGMIGRR